MIIPRGTSKKAADTELREKMGKTQPVKDFQKNPEQK
jgi:hypothetical protein